MNGEDSGGTGDGIVVRPARPDEATAILELWRRAAAEPSVTDDEASVRLALAHPTTTVLVAAVGPELVGSAIAAWDGWRANLYRVIVEPGRRRRGVATRLVGAAEARLREAGAVRVALVTVGDEGPRFWEAAGYRPRPTDRRYVKDLGR